MVTREGDLVFSRGKKFSELQEIAKWKLPYKSSRPFCVAMRDIRNSNILWVVPLSTKVERI